MRLLLIEDDQKIASFIVYGLRQAGFAVDHATDGESGLDLALTVTYDAAIVDLMLPRLDGLSLIDRLRQKGINTPVLILSAKRALDNRIEGLQRGGGRLSCQGFCVFRIVGTGSSLDSQGNRNGG